ncbi:MAG TPA: 3-isopropylmalate dehydrogenase [Ruminococcaceae bacterium]|nr:3-isopropylmalate dehydrogenase [Oscillospiraceae bacterium]
MSYKIALLKGDGIGPEITEGAVQVLKEIEKKFNLSFEFTEYPIGGYAIDHFGIPLPQETVDGCKNSDAVLLGAVGGPKWDNQPSCNRPEKALLGIRSALGLYINLRPAKLYPSLLDECPLKREKVENGFDLLIVRELTGGIYFGERGRRIGKYGEEAYDTECYSEMEIDRIMKFTFDCARLRNKNIISVDKANVLESSVLWRRIFDEYAAKNPDIACKSMFVDNAAMQLIRDPSQFDIIVTSNMFGDILSDEASQLTGSIGLLPSASLGQSNPGLYEPIHGSAPDIAGTGKANPIATVLSAAMMLRYSLGLEAAANAIEAAVNRTVEQGKRTCDMSVNPSAAPLNTTEMTDAIIKNL